MVSLLHGTFIGSNLCDPFIFFHGLMVMAIDKFVNYQKRLGLLTHCRYDAVHECCFLSHFQTQLFSENPMKAT